MACAGSDNGSAVIFDLWGTLVPFDAALWADCEGRIVDALGADSHAFRTQWHADYPARVVGTLEDSFRRVCSATGVLAEDAVIARAVQIRSDAHARMFRPRDDAVATLRKLRQAGYRTGLITNCTSEIPQLWRASALSPLVDHAVFSCAARARKPDASIYRLAASGLDVDPSHCIYVGDGADRELEGAASAGMRPIRLDAPDTDPPESWRAETVLCLADIPALRSSEPHRLSFAQGSSGTLAQPSALSPGG
jgi:putative hydrolase of the HAD superfamily